jgi:hypothetical protein
MFVSIHNIYTYVSSHHVSHLYVYVCKVVFCKQTCTQIWNDTDVDPWLHTLNNVDSWFHVSNQQGTYTCVSLAHIGTYIHNPSACREAKCCHVRLHTYIHTYIIPKACTGVECCNPVHIFAYIHTPHIQYLFTTSRARERKSCNAYTHIYISQRAERSNVAMSTHIHTYIHTNTISTTACWKVKCSIIHVQIVRGDDGIQAFCEVRTSIPFVLSCVCMHVCVCVCVYVDENCCECPWDTDIGHRTFCKIRTSIMFFVYMCLSMKIIPVTMGYRHWVRSEPCVCIGIYACIYAWLHDHVFDMTVGNKNFVRSER